MVEKDLMALIYKLPRNVWPDELSTANYQNVHAVLTRQEELEDLVAARGLEPRTYGL